MADIRTAGSAHREAQALPTRRSTSSSASACWSTRSSAGSCSSRRSAARPTVLKDRGADAIEPSSPPLARPRARRRRAADRGRGHLPPCDGDAVRAGHAGDPARALPHRPGDGNRVQLDHAGGLDGDRGYQIVPIAVAFDGNFYELSDFLFRLRTLVGVRRSELQATGRLFSIETIDFGESPERIPGHHRGPDDQCLCLRHGRTANAPRRRRPALPPRATAAAPAGRRRR